MVKTNTINQRIKTEERQVQPSLFARIQGFPLAPPSLLCPLLWELQVQAMKTSQLVLLPRKLLPQTPHYPVSAK